MRREWALYSVRPCEPLPHLYTAKHPSGAIKHTNTPGQRNSSVFLWKFYNRQPVLVAAARALYSVERQK